MCSVISHQVLRLGFGPVLRFSAGVCKFQISHAPQLEPCSGEILSYYARGGDGARLVQATEGLLEQARTEELLQRFLPPPPELVCSASGADPADGR